MENVVIYYPDYFTEVYGYTGKGVDMFVHFAKFKLTDTYKTLEKYCDTLSFIGGFFGVISNLFFVVVLLNIKGSLRSQLKLLLSLAVSDFVQSALHIMMRYIEFDTVWKIRFTLDVGSASPAQYVAKRFLSDLYFLSDLTGHVMLVVMAIDIFLAVRNPLSYRSLMSKHRGNIIIVVIWIVCYIIVAISTLVIEIVFRTTEIGEENFGLTTVGYSYLYYNARELNLIFFLAILCIYIAIAIKVNRQKFRSLSVAKQLKMVLILGVIVLSYMFCSCPFFGNAYFITAESNSSFIESLIVVFFERIQFIANSYRSFFNTIIYAARIPEVQGQIRSCSKKIVVTRAGAHRTKTTIRTASKRVNNSQEME